ncbi:hypothetical protein CEXT_572581 [Caerostris extrusa]|uniref:Uncharacterized protein n=1 Tax=Caerostris extrusa TaxID=172846 RepID=A0AAV4P2I5_CAEEX|nr:hypothetical protein CEXT_572581 [Caerostris extrusa]
MNAQKDESEKASFLPGDNDLEKKGKSQLLKGTMLSAEWRGIRVKNFSSQAGVLTHKPTPETEREKTLADFPIVVLTCKSSQS